MEALVGCVTGILVLVRAWVGVRDGDGLSVGLGMGVVVVGGEVR